MSLLDVLLHGATWQTRGISVDTANPGESLTQKDEHPESARVPLQDHTEEIIYGAGITLGPSHTLSFPREPSRHPNLVLCHDLVSRCQTLRGGGIPTAKRHEPGQGKQQKPSLLLTLLWCLPTP